MRVQNSFSLCPHGSPGIRWPYGKALPRKLACRAFAGWCSSLQPPSLLSLPQCWTLEEPEFPLEAKKHHSSGCHAASWFASSCPRGSKGKTHSGFHAIRDSFVSICHVKGSIKCCRKDKILFLLRGFNDTSSMDPCSTSTQLLAPWVEIGDFSGKEQPVFAPQNYRQKQIGLWQWESGTFTRKKKKKSFQLSVPQRIMHQSKVDCRDIPQQDDFYPG